MDLGSCSIDVGTTVGAIEMGYFVDLGEASILLDTRFANPVDAGESEIVLTADVQDASLKGSLSFEAQARPTVNIIANMSLKPGPAIPPPSISKSYIRRVSVIMPEIIGTNQRGEPVG